MNFRPSPVRAIGAFVASRYGLHRPQQARVGYCDVDALIQKKAVEHQPGYAIHKNTLSFGRGATKVLNQTVPSSGKETALSAAVVDRTSTQRTAN